MARGAQEEEEEEEAAKEALSLTTQVRYQPSRCGPPGPAENLLNEEEDDRSCCLYNVN